MDDLLRTPFQQINFGRAASLDGAATSESLILGFCPSETRNGDECCSSSSTSISTITNASSPGKRRNQRSSFIVATRKDSEIELMKEKFAKLLLGEDMSGGGKGVCSALAISNAITNLSASVFGEIWRLEPLSVERKTMWRREMEWLLSIANYIVEFVPCLQALPDGTKMEVMISRPRADLQVNVPALQKLDAMLLESLEHFDRAEFWYVEHGSNEEDADGVQTSRHEEKWWLPSVKVPDEGLSEGERKRLQHQKDCVTQILKAALAINSQVLSEMEIPDAYWNALPKTGKASLGECFYKNITSDGFSPEAFLAACDISSEHEIVDMANRLEAAVHVWRRRNLSQKTCQNTKNSWVIVKDFVSDGERRELLAERAESTLVCLKQRFPDLRQSFLDVTKIQYNKDVGQSILESYSRVLESLASNIVSRIDDILYVDEMTRHAIQEAPPPVRTYTASSRRPVYPLSFSLNPSLYGTPFGTPSASPTSSPSPRSTAVSPPFQPRQNVQALSDFLYFNYETEHDVLVNNQRRQAYKKPQLSKAGMLSRSLNSSRSQCVYPVYEE